MTWEAPEAQFGLPGNADQFRMLKASADGPHRIITVTERTFRRCPAEPAGLTADGFQIRRQASACRPSPVNPVLFVGLPVAPVIIDMQVLTGCRQ